MLILFWPRTVERGATAAPKPDFSHTTSGGGANVPTDADRAELRRLLDGLGDVLWGLPRTLDQPEPIAAQTARVLGRQIREWKRAFHASPEDERLAAAAARFATALAYYLEEPGVLGAYEASYRAWTAWDKADDTWETADE
jgi:hypothetical protein